MADTSAFQRLVDLIEAQAEIIDSMRQHIQAIESIGGGGGNASFTDYTSGTEYKRNNVVVDTNTETCYRVLEDYTSNTVETDVANHKLKLLAAEGQIIGVSHVPQASEIENYPDGAYIAVYSTSGSGYLPPDNQSND